MPDWFKEHQEILAWAGSLSLLTFVLSIAALALVIIWLPQDYFARDQRLPCHRIPKRSLLWVILAVFKNLLGVLLILLGLVFLVTPGQGLLTILIGLSLTNFPGKYRLESRLVRQPTIRKSLNAIRLRAGKKPLHLS